MAKEIQETLGAVDEMPMSESATEGDELSGDADSIETGATVTDESPTEADFADDAVPSEDDLEAALSDDDATERNGSAPAATLASWLADELRPSPSKSLAPAALESPETLAPVAVPPEELSEEELAVLPPGARPGRSRSPFGRVLVAGLGALAAVLVFAYLRRPAPSETVDSASAAEPAPSDPTEGTSAPAPRAPADAAAPTETAAEEPAQKQLRYWGPSSTAEPEAGDSDDPMQLRGPSVGRFPDLPPEFWSEMRRRDVESRAESAQQSAADPLAP